MKGCWAYPVLIVSVSAMLSMCVLVNDSSVPFDPCLTDDEGTEYRTYYFEGNEIELPIHLNEVKGYHSNFTRHFGASFTAGKYTTYEDRTMERLLALLMPYMDGMSDSERAESLLTFVQNSFGYVTDQEHFGCKEYTMFPAEVLLSGEGDCEDTAILLHTLYKMIGLDSVIISVPDHFMVGVAGDFKGEYVRKTLSLDDTRYYTADTTGNKPIGWVVADDAVIVSDTPMQPCWIILMVCLTGYFLTVIALITRSEDEK